MMDNLLNSYKTTIGGILAALGAALMVAPLPEKYQWIPPFMVALGSGLIGLTAKDSTVHSTQAEVRTATEEKKVETKKADG